MSKHTAHRPGAFKQVNKSHKTGRHRSKGAINNEVKGNILNIFFNISNNNNNACINKNVDILNFTNISLLV